MVHTNSSIKIYQANETNYGGGDGGAEYAMTHPSADNMTRVNLLTGKLLMKAKIFKRERITPAGMDLGKAKVVTVGADFNEIEFSYYLQTAADPFLTIAKAGTRGTANTSKYFQITVPDPDESGATVVYNVFGAQMTSYSPQGSNNSNKPPLVVVKFTCFDIALNSGTVQTAVLPSGVINEWDDITVTLDSDAITELTKYEFTVEFKYSKADSGRNSSFARFKPLLTDKMLNAKISFLKDSAALIFDVMTQTLNKFTSAFTDGTNTLSITNTFVTDAKLFDYDMSSDDRVEYDLTISSEESVFS